MYILLWKPHYDLGLSKANGLAGAIEIECIGSRVPDTEWSIASIIQAAGNRLLEALARGQRIGERRLQNHERTSERSDLLRRKVTSGALRAIVVLKDIESGLLQHYIYTISRW